MKKAGLTVVALAWREGEQLRSCFGSLRPLLEQTGAETLIVLDAEADPITAAIAGEVADRVALHPFSNFAAQRNRALDLARSEWVFFIDADEQMTPQLARELGLATMGQGHAAYRVPRRNILFGHEVRYAGWWPDYQIRLLCRAACRYDESRKVHELPNVTGSIGTLQQPLLHYNYKSWRQFIEKQRAYAPLDAQARYEAGARARPRSFIGQPLREFKRRFIEYRGYRGGLLGFALSTAMSLYTLLVYLHLWRLQHREV